MKCKKMWFGLGCVSILIIAFCLLFFCRGQKFEVSGHSDGRRFYNNPPSEDKKVSEVIKWRIERVVDGIVGWKRSDVRMLDVVKVYSPFLGKDKVFVSFIGHSTFLIRLGDKNILTDPVFSDRVGLFGVVGPKRYTEPGVKFEDLPRIDFALISHNHYDHLDIPTLRKLHVAFGTRFVTGLGNCRIIVGAIKGARCMELDWWHDLDVANDLRISFVPAKHWSRRGLTDSNKTLWGSFVVKYLKKNFYISGDTAYGGHFKEARDVFGEFEFALLPIGSYKPRWFMKSAHANPDEILMAYKDLGAKRAVFMHFNTFDLGDDKYNEAVLAMNDVIAKNKSVKRGDLIVPKFGESFIFNFEE